MSLAILKSLGPAEIVFLIALVIPVISLIAITVYLVFLRRAKLRKCPFCAEWVKPDAVVCRFCGRDLPVSENSKTL